MRKTAESLATTLCDEDTDMMLDWNAYRRQLVLGVKEILSMPCSFVGTPSFIWTR
jgi:hypothetical protein